MVEEAKRMDHHPSRNGRPRSWRSSRWASWSAPRCSVAGGFFSDTRGGISRLEAQQKSMDGRLQQIVDRLDRGPRVEQVQELYRVNAQQDGRMDAMREAYEKRIRDLELQYMEQKVRLDGIAAAGRNLSGR